jgi:hypothetical protein
MNRLFLIILFVLLCVRTTQGAVIPYYGMDSSAFLADVIVFCEEQDVQVTRVLIKSCVANTTFDFSDISACQRPDFKVFQQPVTELPHDGWSQVLRTTTKCKVLQSFKGSLGVGSDLSIEYDSTFRRQVEYNWHQIPPPGRVLLFLKERDLRPQRVNFRPAHQNPSLYEVVAAKLVQGEQVFRFVQIWNPGPRVLTKQKPEKFKLPEGGKYTEKELLEDLSIALRNAASIKEPVSINAFEVGRATK